MSASSRCLAGLASLLLSFTLTACGASRPIAAADVPAAGTIGQWVQADIPAELTIPSDAPITRGLHYGYSDLLATGPALYLSASNMALFASTDHGASWWELEPELDCDAVADLGDTRYCFSHNGIHISIRVALAHAELALAQQDWSAALTHSDAVLDDSERLRPKYHALLLRARAIALHHLEQPADAVSTLQRALDLDATQTSPALRLRLLHTAIVLQPDEAEAHLTHARETVQHILDHLSIPDVRAALLANHPIFQHLELLSPG